MMLRWLSRLCAMALAVALGVGSAHAQVKLEGDMKVALLHLATVNDGGWSESHEIGRQLTERELGIEIAYTENVPEDNSVLLQTTDLYTGRGYNVIIGTSYGYGDAFLEASKKYPNTIFLNSAGETNGPNLESFYARTYQGWYLAGILAGHMTKTKKIGYIAGFPISVVNWDVNGFLRGAQSVDPEIEMIALYVNSWYDPAKEGQAAQAMLEQGADVIGTNGSAATPLIAAEKAGAYAVGYQIDMSKNAPKAVITSMLFHWEAYYVPKLKAIMAGEWTPEPGGAFWGIDTGIVGLSPSPDFVPKEALEAVEKAKQAMIEGTLTPYDGPVYKQDGTLIVEEGRSMTDDELWAMNYFVQGVIGSMPTE
ncbi:MAG TPA: BMP family ABC transporter substrate-binding protein [Alphaproteobacteria bacterium]|nr:BMP family ABC transporter substrate-binding protein [Alphaproteobacteria bacterium]